MTGYPQQSHAISGVNWFNGYFTLHPYWVIFNLVVRHPLSPHPIWSSHPHPAKPILITRITQAISFLTLYTINAAYPIPVFPPVTQVPPTVGDSIAKMANLSTDVKAKLAEGPQLDPPKDTPFTPAELKFYDGQVEGEKIYVAIKGIVFDGQ